MGFRILGFCAKSQNLVAKGEGSGGKGFRILEFLRREVAREKRKDALHSNEIPLKGFSNRSFDTVYFYPYMPKYR